MAKPESQAGGLEARIGRAVASLYRWLPRNRFTRTPWAVIQTFSHAQGALLSGSMAYYTFLSLLPLLMVTGFVIGTISQASAGIKEALAGAIGDLFPGVQGRRIVNQLIGARVAFGVFGTLTLIYSGTGFVGALTASLNRIWVVPAGRDPLRQKLVNLLVVVLLGVVLLASVGLTAWVSYVTRAALGTRGSGVVRIIEFTASPLSLLGVLLLLYRLLPARKMSLRTHLPGAVLGAVGVEILKRGFAFWAERSTGVEALPRSLLSVVLLLVWLGFFGQLILYGAALNVVRDRQRRGLSLVPDSASVPGNNA